MMNRFSISSLDFRVIDIKSIINDNMLLDAVNEFFGKTYKVSEYKGDNINEIYRYFEILKGYDNIGKINDFGNDKPSFNLDIFKNTGKCYGILEIFKNDDENIYIIQA